MMITLPKPVGDSSKIRGELPTAGLSPIVANKKVALSALGEQM